MKSVEWEKIQMNIGMLEEVQVYEIQGSLIQNGLLATRDIDRIKEQKGKAKKMDTLLEILRNKPASLKAYSGLLKSLSGTYAHIVEEMEKVKATGDPKFMAKVDPSEYKDEVRKVLYEKYTNQPGKTKLSDVMETVQKNVRGGFNWNKKELSEFICKIFGNVTIEKDKFNGSKKKLEYPVNNQNFSGMDHIQLKTYLDEFFLEKNLTTDLPNVLMNEMITGEVLLSMTEEEIKDVSHAPFGIIRTLTKKIEELKQCIELGSSSQLKTESLRKFDSETNSSLCYNHGNTVDTTIKTRGKLDPIRSFHLLEIQEIVDFQLEELASKTIQFASACINERQNGTIYFGIDSSTGCITGMATKKEDVQTILRSFIEKSFLKEIEPKIQLVIRSPVFVDVNEAGKRGKKFVIEVDVVPSCRYLGSLVVKTKLKDLKICSKTEKKLRKYGFFYFPSQNGEPEMFETHNIPEFPKHVEKAQEMRLEEEENILSSTPENLRKKLLNLLTGGREVLEDSIYPFFILSPLDPVIDTTFISNNVQFIRHLQADIVFDFDPTGSSKGIYRDFDQTQGEVMTVMTVKNFLAQENSKEYSTFIESLTSDTILPWVFCNGHEPTSFNELSPTDWNQHIRSAFQKCLKHFAGGRPKDRILVIICLFSKCYDTMLEGFEEMVTNFSKQWVLYAESEHIADAWKKEMIRRKKLTEKDVTERCIVGMTWEQINNTISQATQLGEIGGCMMPQAARTFINISDKKLKCWYDVELVSAADPDLDEENDKSKKVMASFYKGESVDWLNFWFEGQVIKRSHHKELLDTVTQALNGKTKDDEKVSTVVLFHHPGSGATTSAKKVLWELRKNFRCCMLRSISEQTCSQLIEIWKFSEPSTSPLPLLILVDNEDEEKYRQLKQNLEEKCQAICKQSIEQSKIFCTMLVCIRKATLPLQVMSSQIISEQKLTKQEQKLFKKKHSQITKAFENNKEEIDPKYLISFNILKSDFNTEYVANVVKEFVDDIKDERELTLLTYIALLNKYDPQFRAIPISCFDAIFKIPLNISNIKRRNTNWEANLSEAAQVLLNFSPLNKKKPGSARISLRVHHKLLASNLLSYLKNKNGSESDIMTRLINSVVFEQETFDLQTLEDIIGDIMKKRDFNEVDSIKVKEMFSPFITQVNEDEGEDVSLHLLCELFDKNKDPFTAQQICRFYIHLKNWTKAEKYAAIATDKNPRCSFLWDTYGQVYKAQLQEKVKLLKTMDKSRKLPISEVEQVIELARKAIDCFKQEQKECELLPFQYNNENIVAGYFGELKTQIMLLNLLEKNEAFMDRSYLSNCLTNKYFDDHLNFLKPQNINFLKNLEENYTQAMRVLDERYLQIRDEVPFDIAVYSGKFGRDVENLISLMSQFYDYFGTSYNKTTIEKLQEPMASMHRWRVALKHGAMSLNYLLQCRANHRLKDHTLRDIYNLMLPNVNSCHCTSEYILAILNAVTMMMMIDFPVKNIKSLSFEKVLEWCTRLYDCKQSNDRNAYLEPYMYFVMYNFPSEERKKYNICTIKKLQDACFKWREIYKQKFPTAEAKTLFYLSKGGLLNDLVHSDTFPMIRRDNWDNPDMREHLALFKGVVNVGGKEVNIKITTKEGNNFPLSILTSYTVAKDFWQKETYFFIGFSFSGPKAYGIPQDPPNGN